MSEQRTSEDHPSDAAYFASGDAGGSETSAAQQGGSHIDEDISLLDLLIVLAKNKTLLLGLPLIAGLIAAVYSLLQPNVFTAAAKILPPQQSQTASAAALFSQLGAAAGLTGVSGMKNTNDVYLAMLKSRTVADNLIERFDLMKAYEVRNPTQARDRLAGAANIVSGKDGIITIEFDDVDPQRAAEFANAYVDELVKLTQVLAVTEASQRRLFFERQLAQAKNNLARAEMAARQALSSGGLVKVDDQGRAMVETTARLRANITVKEVQISAMRAFATEENAEFRMALRELEAMRRELAKLEGEEVPGAPRRSKVGAQGMESIRLLRDVKYHEVLFEMLAKQFEIAKIDEAKDSSVVQVLDHAVPPDLKSKPRRLLLVLVTALVFLILAVLVAFFREALARAREDPEQARRLENFKRHLVGR